MMKVKAAKCHILRLRLCFAEASRKQVRMTEDFSQSQISNFKSQI